MSTAGTTPTYPHAVQAGWYEVDGPNGPQWRYHDGSTWTGLVMNSDPTRRPVFTRGGEPPTTFEPGWYPDPWYPQDGSRSRYWDGDKFTGHVTGGLPGTAEVQQAISWSLFGKTVGKYEALATLAAAFVLLVLALLILLPRLGRDGESSTTEAASGTSQQSAATTTTVAQPSWRLDTYGDWQLSWTWSVTTVEFRGFLSGGEGNWSFQGHLLDGGNREWRPTSANVSCTLRGDPLVTGAVGTMECEATVDDGGWRGSTEGTFSLRYEDEGVARFKYSGSGSGSSPADENTPITSLELFQPES